MQRPNLNCPFYTSTWTYIIGCIALTIVRFLTAVPTAELEPISKNYVQSDEVCFPKSFSSRETYQSFRPTWVWRMMNSLSSVVSVKSRSVARTAHSRSWCTNGAGFCRLARSEKKAILIWRCKILTLWTDCGESQAVLYPARSQSPQDDHFNSILPRRILQSGWQQCVHNSCLVWRYSYLARRIRSTAVLVQLALPLAV